MEREYYVRGERKTVEEIDDVIALQRSPDDGRPDVEARVFGREAPATELWMSPEEAGAFAQARWVFVEPSAETARALAANEPVPGADVAGKVVRRPNGRFGVVTRRLTVQLSPDVSPDEAEEVLAALRLSVVRRLRFAPNLFEVEGIGHADALEVSVALDPDARVALAEPSIIEHVPARSTPTDPRFDEQWQWANTGQGGGTPGADVRAVAAWGRTLGENMRVAVIDNAFNPAHEDLEAGVGDNSAFFTWEGDFVQGVVDMPVGNHGTFCAGLAGARHNNARGGCGGAPVCELLLIACLPDQVGSQATLARAVAYAADPSTEVDDADPADGADIIVCSLGPNGADWDLEETLRLALQFAASTGRGGRGLAIFWAASNGHNVDVLQDKVVSHEDVIAVVRSTRHDRQDNAARGPAVELIAPGVDVFSTTTTGYGFGTGTSYAAPIAAGCAALALSVNPAFTRDELRQIMRDAADEVGGVTYDEHGHHDEYGFGRVNAHRAVLLAFARTPRRVIDNFGYSAGGWRVDRHPRHVVDVTGDGRADIVGFGNAGVWVALSNGDGTSPSH